MSKTSETSDRLFHLIDVGNLNRTMLDELCQLSTRIRTIAKQREGARFLQGLLAHQRAMLYFTQPSTRTFLSFNNACHVLGIRTSEIRDAATSSEVKGESFEDSIRTFSSYVDVIIMRSPQGGEALQAASLMDRIPRPIPIINAGSGPDQHPTQAMLDIYTLERSFENAGGLEGKVIGMMGDLKRGRTVRSLSRLVRHYPGTQLVLIAPPDFQMRQDILDDLDETGVLYQQTDRLDTCIDGLDALYVTRMQSEWDEAGESGAYDWARFSVGPEQLSMLKPDAIIMHPLPRGPEIDPVIDSDRRVMYWRQERNGMWMRAALLAEIFDVADEIRER